MVLVKKSNGKFRMRVDFIDLKKACPKDSYPLPNIDEMVDATVCHQPYSFLDAAQGYHQIPMFEDDKIKTSFVTDRGTYCYEVMPFGLQNAGATYQRLVNKMFHQLIQDGTMVVYVDDLIVKSQAEDDHPQDLEKVFEVLNRYGMKLNPDKCTFGVKGGQFLGFLISERGIEANPEKITVVLNMQPPKTIRDIQKLNVFVTALARFMSCSAKRCLPFYKALRDVKKF